MGKKYRHGQMGKFSSNKRNNKNRWKLEYVRNGSFIVSGRANYQHVRKHDDVVGAVFLRSEFLLTKWIPV